MGARKSYNPKNKGKKSFPPMLTLVAETREYLGGELRSGDRPSGEQIARPLESVIAALPRQVTTIYARADAGFYCWEAVEALGNPPLHLGGAQDLTLGGTAASREVEALPAHRRRRAMRVPLSTGRLGPGLPIYRLALGEAGEAPSRGRDRARSTVRHAGIHLSGVRHQYDRPHRPAGVVLQPARRGGEPTTTQG